MKRISILLLLVLGMIPFLCGGSKTTRKLYWLFSTNNQIVLRHLVRTDTATLLYVKVNAAHLRRWTMNSKLHLVADGKKLSYRGGTFLEKKSGEVKEYPFATDKENPLMYDTINGNRVYNRDSLLLRFDPMPKNAKTFDFIESDDPIDRPWIALGIKCDEKPYPPLFSHSVTSTPTPDLSTYVPRHAKAVLRGRIHNYRQEMGFFGYLGDERYSIKRETYPFKVWNDSLGNFSYEAEISYPVRLDLCIFGNQWNPVLLIPGEELTIEMDMAAFSTRGAFSPDLLGGKDQNPAVQFRGTYAKLNEFIWGSNCNNMVFSLDVGTPDKSFSQFSEELWKFYKADVSKLNSDPSLDSVQKKFGCLLAQRRYLRSRNKYVENLRQWFELRGQKSDSLLCKNRETEFTLVDPHARELDCFDNLGMLFACSDTSMVAYMEANALTDSPFYKWSMDLRRAQDLAACINRMQPVKDESAWASIASQYVEPLKQLNDTVTKRMETLKQNNMKGQVHETPSVAPEQLIAEIAGQFKGKVVFFDCWATWCGPCRKGIEEMEPMKEELKGKDVVFVYLTDESSEATDWIQDLENISGEHYRIPTSVWQKLPGIGPIPRYFIYDRDGKQILDQTGWNSNFLPEFKETLLKALGE